MNDLNHQMPKAMPLLTITSPETIQKCANLQLESTDIFICSYPKSGTTWTQHIVISLLLLHRKLQSSLQKTATTTTTTPIQDDENSRDLQYNHVSDYAPFFEIDPHWEKDSNFLISSIRDNHHKLGRRVFNTHLRCDMLPRTTYTEDCKNSKFIYILRSPLDVCVSFYYHLSHQVEGCYDKSFDEFFNEWVDGRIPFGTWIDHVTSYLPYLITNNNSCDDRKIGDHYKNGQSKQVLLITYEEMIQDLHGVIHKIVKYLDLDDLITSKEIMNIMDTFTFESMKNDLDRFQPKSVNWKDDFKFLRKGLIGDSKEVVTNEQMVLFRMKLEESNFIHTLSATMKGNLEGVDTIQQVINSIID